MNNLQLISPIPLSVNHYLKPKLIYMSNGKARVVMYETAEAKRYKKQFATYTRNQVQKQGWKISDNKYQHIYCDCVFYFDRIDKDCNNYFKLLLDAITESEVVWADDNIVCERVNAIYYDSKNPRIELNIYPTDYTGVFDNQLMLETFTKKCESCSRYRKGRCSLLLSAQQGRIQDEITNGICDAYKQGKDKK